MTHSRISLFAALLTLVPALCLGQVRTSAVPVAPAVPGVPGLGAGLAPLTPALAAPSLAAPGLAAPSALPLVSAPAPMTAGPAPTIPVVRGEPVKALPFETYIPYAIEYSKLQDTILMQGDLNKSFSLSVRIAPGKVEVSRKHFLKPAEEWRAATPDEVKGLSAALKRYTAGLAEDARDRNLYRVAYGALLVPQPTLQELRRLKDKLVGMLVHPFVPLQGFRVMGVGLTGRSVVVNVLSEDQIPAARAYVEKHLPEEARWVTYKVAGPVKAQAAEGTILAP